MLRQVRENRNLDSYYDSKFGLSPNFSYFEFYFIVNDRSILVFSAKRKI
jgi:hypothetical protein